MLYSLSAALWSDTPTTPAIFSILGDIRIVLQGSAASHNQGPVFALSISTTLVMYLGQQRIHRHNVLIHRKQNVLPLRYWLQRLRDVK